MELVGNVAALLMAQVARQTGKAALCYKEQGKYTPISYGDLFRQVRGIAYGLDLMGMKPGDRIGILSANRPEWVISDLAVLALRGIVVPIFPRSLPKRFTIF